MAAPFTKVDLLPDFVRANRLKNSRPAIPIPGTSIAFDTFDPRGSQRRIAFEIAAADAKLAASIARLQSRLVHTVPDAEIITKQVVGYSTLSRTVSSGNYITTEDGDTILTEDGLGLSPE